MPYSARCLTRGEFATLGLADVDAMLADLPYLRRRFEDFADGVRASQKRGSLGSARPVSSSLRLA